MSRKTFAVLFLVLVSAVAVTAQPNLFPGKPDLLISIGSDGVMAVRNMGSGDVPSSFTVHVTCTVTTPSTRGQTCGAPFVNGVYQPSLTLPAGHGQSPIKHSPGQQTLIQYGPGWAVIYPAMPTWTKGTYQFTAKVDSTNKIDEENEANNNASALVTKN
jgi:hypothetical protein